MHKKALIYFIETLLDLETYSAIDVIFNSLWTDVWIINRQHNTCQVFYFLQTVSIV